MGVYTALLAEHTALLGVYRVLLGVYTGLLAENGALLFDGTGVYTALLAEYRALLFDGTRRHCNTRESRERYSNRALLSMYRAVLGVFMALFNIS